MSQLPGNENKAKAIDKGYELRCLSVLSPSVLKSLRIKLTMAHAIHRLEKMFKFIGRDVTAVHSTAMPVLV